MKALLNTFAVLGVLYVTGCATYDPVVAIPQEPVPVHITLPPAPAPLVVINNPGDVTEVVLAAVALGDAGRHSDASELYRDATKTVRSRNGLLEHDLAQAWVCSAWQAGEVSSVRQGFQQLDALQRRYRYVKFQEIEAVKEIRAVIAQYSDNE